MQFNPAPYNPRKIDHKQAAALAKAMEHFGDLSGIVVNTRSGNLVGGHQRVKMFGGLEASALKVEKQPLADGCGTVASGYVDTPWGRWAYREVDWDDATEKAANLAANKHGGSWDLDKLDVVLEELQQIDYDMELTGFDCADVQPLAGADEQDGAGPEDNYAPQFGVIVMCDDERHQQAAYNFLIGHGYACKVVCT